MADKPFVANAIYDSLFEFSGGMNSGVAAVLLPKNQLAYASNATVRGTFAQPRPPWVQYALDFGGNAALEGAVYGGRWQGSAFFIPDVGDPTLMAAISGHLYQFTPLANNVATVADVTGGNPQSLGAVENWLWQAEKWLIWNDGVSPPVFWDNTTTTRSNFATQFSNALAAPFNIPVNTPTGTGGLAVTLNSNYLGALGDIVTVGVFPDAPKLLVTLIVLNVVTGTLIFGATDALHSVTFGVGTPVTGRPANLQLPPGKMGVYGLGRNWVCLPDGKQFIASDLVGGPSGTFENNFRNSVLFVTENNYLVGGGNFTIPGNVGSIKAMRFTATLDQALGQGPLEIFTATNAFSCQAPIDRLTWQSLQNPILTQSLIGNGAMGQNSTIPLNSDTIFRSVDGIRSLILARRDFDVWGNTPISREVEIDLLKDQQDLLRFGSAANFDNRLLMTISPKAVTEDIPARPGYASVLTANVSITTGPGTPLTFLVANDFPGNVGDTIECGGDHFQVTGWKPGIIYVINLDVTFAPPVTSVLLLAGTAVNRAATAAFTETVGAYFRGLVALNLDPLSTMRGKAPSVYDGSWIGVNFLQLLTGEINFAQRCFAFTFSVSANHLELIELLPGSTTVINDNSVNPIVWGFESPIIFRDEDPRRRQFKRLLNGEIFIDDLIGRVDFQVWYRPDDYPCWIPWLAWSECADNTLAGQTPQFRPEIGIGEPTGRLCDPVTNRPFREGFYFQVKIQIVGQCRFKGARFMAITIPDPTFPRPPCDGICGDVLIPCAT